MNESNLFECDNGLYRDNNPCEGCSIKSTRNFLCRLEGTASAKYSDVIFISSSYLRSDLGEVENIRSSELKALHPALKLLKNNDKKYTFLAASKCLNIKEADMSSSDMNICRKFIHSQILDINPKLIFVMGNLALKMVTKKSGILKKRGTVFPIEIDGREFLIAPIFHPSTPIIEPSKYNLFVQDLKNAINKYILFKNTKLELDYEILQTKEQLKSYEWLFDTELTLAIDTEATGLSHLYDVLTTVGVCFGDKSIIVPMEHKESTLQLDDAVRFVKNVCKNPKNVKIFHNAKYDIRMLKKYGITVSNIQDTKVLFHVVESEEEPKGLMDLVKRYYPEYLEEL